MVTRRPSRILVSLHDVWPGNFASVDRDLQWLRERGAAAPALFVVPRYHGGMPFDENPAFVEWLRGQIDGNASLFVHGYFHLRAERCGEKIRRSPWGKWVNGRLQDEGEFAGLSVADAVAFLQKSFRHFRTANLDPVGLALPAWVGKVPTGFVFPAVCRFVDGRFFVTDATTRRKLWAPPLTFGQRVGGNAPFVFGGKIGLRYLSGQKLLRLVLHPGDLEHASVREVVAAFLKQREAISYAQAFLP